MSGLFDAIAEDISSRGPMRFDRYMEMALYHPELGYYTRHVPGEVGMWRTSPTVSERFGELIGRGLLRSWEILGEPREYTVVEAGAGKGDLAMQVFSSAGGGFLDSLRWHIIERQPPIREHQEKALAGLPVSWSETAPVPTTGCFLANEVADNIPARVFAVDEGRLTEVHVDLRDGQLCEVLVDSHLQPPADLADAERFEIQDYDQLAGVSWSSIDRGHLMLIDYGDVEPQVFHPFGTLVCYRGEHLDIDPLSAPGDKDITCHVNLTQLTRTLTSKGWVVQPPITQRELLIALGVEEIARELKSRGEDISALAELGRLSLLYRRGALGDLRVLLGSKDAEPLTFP